MSTLDDHLEDPNYVLWVEAGTCLGFLKPFLESLAENISLSLHETVLNNIHVCRQKQSNPACMKMCDNSHISFKKTMNKWIINCCANCQCYIDQLVKCCDQPFKLKRFNWDGSNRQLWPMDSWEKAKVYMDTNQRSSHQPCDTDFSALVNFIDHCWVPGSCWRPSGIFKLKLDKVSLLLYLVIRTLQMLVNFSDYFGMVNRMTLPIVY